MIVLVLHIVSSLCDYFEFIIRNLNGIKHQKREDQIDPL